jgi:signal transduction histidine kinase
VLLNLGDNSIRHVPPGGRVEVAIGQRGGWADIQVADSGPGIAPEHLARLFDRFYRVDPARDRDRGGAGLGLAISRWIVDAHGGSITVQSEVGRGTTFTVRLPLARDRSLRVPSGDGAAVS